MSHIIHILDDLREDVVDWMLCGAQCAKAPAELPEGFSFVLDTVDGVPIATCELCKQVSHQRVLQDIDDTE